MARTTNHILPRRRGARATPLPVDPSSSLGIYFREMSDLSVMSAQQELAAAERIIKQRRDHWRALMSYPPFASAIVELVEHNLEAADTAPLRKLVRAARAVRDRDVKSNRVRYVECVGKVADELCRIDVDGVVSDRVCADLNTIEQGHREGLNMKIVLPRQGSQPFRKYLDRVRRSGAALWAAKHAFVKANLRLVVTMARRFNRGGLSLQDLIQEGNIGLMKAVDRFDPDRGFRFSTYGSWWIRHAISRALADKGRSVRLPVHMIDVHHKLKRSRSEFEAKHGRQPTNAELAERSGVALEKIEKMARFLLEAGPSLDRPISEGDGRTGVDLLEDPDHETAADHLEAAALGDGVRDAIDALRPIEADIVRKRFGLDDVEPMTLKEIGQQYSLSRERIRQLQEQALGKLRRELARKELL